MNKNISSSRGPFAAAIPAICLLLGMMLLPAGCGKKGAVRIDCPGCPDAVVGGDSSKGLEITVCSNHGHAVRDDIMKIGPESYDIKGDSDHNHTIYINGGFYRDLGQNRGIQVISSSTNGHTHRVTINCAK